MKVCEKIKLLRKQWGWSQEYVANKVAISLNSYGAIERGDTNLNLSRLEELSKAFDVEVAEFFESGEQQIFNLGGLNNNQSHWQINSHSMDYVQLHHELEKQQLLNAEKDKEIAYLKEIIELMKSKS